MLIYKDIGDYGVQLTETSTRRTYTSTIHKSRALNKEIVDKRLEDEVAAALEALYECVPELFLVYHRAKDDFGKILPLHLPLGEGKVQTTTTSGPRNRFRITPISGNSYIEAIIPYDMDFFDQWQLIDPVIMEEEVVKSTLYSYKDILTFFINQGCNVNTLPNYVSDI